MFSKSDIESYFNDEKRVSGIFCIIGALTILLSLVFLIIIKKHFYTGLAIPFLLLGLLFFVAGYTVYKRSDDDRIRNVYAYDMNPGELKQKELPRMKIVLKNFVIYRYIQIIFILVGAGIYIYFIRDITRDLWRGVGLGLALMVLLALVADLFAEKRARTYSKGIESYLATKK